jgi:hypothetical protein
MLESGLVMKQGDRWRLAPKGRRLAATMKVSCWIFRNKPQNERL